MRNGQRNSEERVAMCLFKKIHVMLKRMATGTKVLLPKNRKNEKCSLVKEKLVRLEQVFKELRIGKK